MINLRRRISERLDISIQKGALMSSTDARRAYLALIIGALMAIIFSSIAMSGVHDNRLLEYGCWALVGLGLFGFITLPPVLYGYHNRHRIEPADEMRPYDFSQANRAGIIAAGGVPLLKALLDWLGLGG